MSEILGDEFVKFYVCSYNRWNPYSDEVRMLPDIYWTLNFHLINMELTKQWNSLHRPAAELTGQIANPQVFKAYYESVKREERKKKQKEQSKDPGYYEDNKRDMTGNKMYAEAETDYHYDPNLGVVDTQGRIVIPKENYDKLIGLDGVAISY